MNPRVFHHPDIGMQLEQHGDDFFGTGPRASVLATKRMLEESSLVKKTEVVSFYPEDDKEGRFLKRKITVDQDGWRCKLDERYSTDLLSWLGLKKGGKSVITPGSKESTFESINTTALRD